MGLIIQPRPHGTRRERDTVRHSTKVPPSASSMRQDPGSSGFRDEHGSLPDMEKTSFNVGGLGGSFDQNLPAPKLRSPLGIVVGPQERKLAFKALSEEALSPFHVGIESRHRLGAQLDCGLGGGVRNQNRKQQDKDTDSGISRKYSVNPSLR